MRGRVLSLIAVLAIVAAACSSTPAATSAPTAAPATAAPVTAAPTAAGSARDTLQMHWLGDCTCIWHPAAYETFSQALNFELMFSTLIDHNWKSELEVELRGDLADSWSTSDAKTFTFKLHPGVKWHDGQPFTADDVIWTINESMKWSPGRYKNEAWDVLVGSKAVREGKADTVSGAKKIDGNTVELTIEAADANWLNNLTEPDAAILPMHVLKDLLKGVAKDKVQGTIETSAFATTSPIGTGPYKFIKYETDQYSQFEAFPDYFQGAPKIKNIFVKRLKGDAAIAAGEAGELDLSIRLNPADAGRVQKAANLDAILASGVGTYGPQFNLLSKCDLSCRKAVSYGIDAPGIIASIFGGLGKTNEGVNPGMPASDDFEFFKFDPDKAKAELQKSSWDKSKTLRIVFDNTFAGVTLWTPVMQQNLEAIGFKVELLGLETTAAIEYYNKITDYEILIMQGGDQGVGPFKQQSYYNCKIDSPQVWKTYARDCKIDEFFQQAKLEPDATKQLALLKQVSGITNKIVDKTSLWTTKTLNFKSKCLTGPIVSANTREFITSKVWLWSFTC